MIRDPTWFVTITDLETEKKDASEMAGKADGCLSQDDLIKKSPQSSESTPRRLQKQIDKAIGDHHTSSSMINAAVGGISTRGTENLSCDNMCLTFLWHLTGLVLQIIGKNEIELAIANHNLQIFKTSVIID